MKMTCEQLTFKNKSIKKSKKILNYTKKVIKTGVVLAQEQINE